MMEIITMEAEGGIESDGASLGRACAMSRESKGISKAKDLSSR